MLDTILTVFVGIIMIAFLLLTLVSYFKIVPQYCRTKIEEDEPFPAPNTEKTVQLKGSAKLSRKSNAPALTQPIYDADITGPMVFFHDSYNHSHLDIGSCDTVGDCGGCDCGGD